MSTSRIRSLLFVTRFCQHSSRSRSASARLRTWSSKLSEMPHRGTETEFELTTIERLERLDYRYSHGEDLQRPREEVVLKETLPNELARLYPDLPSSSIATPVARFSGPHAVESI